MDPIKTAESLGQQTDRVLFIAAIVLLVSGGLMGLRWVAKYFIKQNESLIADFKVHRAECAANTARLNDDRCKENASYVKTLTESNTSRLELARSLETLTEATTDNTEFLRRLSDTMAAQLLTRTTSK